MGQQSSSISEANRLYEMPLSQYILKQRINSALSVWKRKSPPFQQLLECRMVVNTEEQLKQIYDIFKMRHMHIYLPATRYLTCELQGIKRCGGYFKGNVYVQSVVTTLLMINDIPFLDSLHLYSIAFKGFEILYKQFGYFDVFQDMFHICENGKVKVWCNSQIYKLKPQNYLLDSTGKQQDMIYRIINLIDENVDKSESINFKRQLYKKLPNHTHLRTFQQCNLILRQICKQNGWQPPQRLKCISQLTKQDLQKLLLQQQSQQHIYKQNSNNQYVATTNTLNHETINKLTGDGKTSLRLSPRNEIYQNFTNFQYNPQPQIVPIVRQNILSFPPSNLNKDSLTLQSNIHHNYSTPIIRSQLIQPVPQAQPFFTTRNHRQINPIQNKLQAFSPNQNLRILSVQRRDKSTNNKPICFIPIQPTIQPVISTPIKPNNQLNLNILSPKINQTKNFSQFQQRHPRIPPNNSFTNRINLYNNNLSHQNLTNNYHQSSEKHKSIQQPYKVNINKNTIIKNETPKNLIKITYKNELRGQNSPRNINDATLKIVQPTIQTNNFDKIKQNNLNNTKNVELTENIRKNIPSPKVLKSFIIPDQIQAQKNLNNIQFQQNHINQNFKIFPKVNETTSKIISNSRPSSDLKRNFIQRFQQSLQSEHMTYQFELNLRNKSQQNTLNYNKTQFNNTQLQNMKKQISQNDKKRIEYNDTKSQYTDPKLFEMLSSKDRSNITINPTFNFTLNNQSGENKQIINKSNINQQKINDNQLYFSFSNSENQSFKYTQHNKQKYFKQFASNPLQQTFFSSQQSNNSIRKKYQNQIDKQIWKDLLELKKNRNKT